MIRPHHDQSSRQVVHAFAAPSAEKSGVAPSRRPRARPVKSARARRPSCTPPLHPLLRHRGTSAPTAGAPAAATRRPSATRRGSGAALLRPRRAPCAGSAGGALATAVRLCGARSTTARTRAAGDLGVRPPRCTPPAGLRGCEVHVFGPRGNGTLEVTEACPSAHPCNRCKGARNPCASYDPLHVDVCGLRWADFFAPAEAEAEALVTLSCFGASRASAVPPPPPGCASAHDDDVGSAVCEAWCSADYADSNCSYCKCRACLLRRRRHRRRTPVATALVAAVVVGLAVALLGRRCQRVADPVFEARLRRAAYTSRWGRACRRRARAQLAPWAAPTGGGYAQCSGRRRWVS